MSAAPGGGSGRRGARAPHPRVERQAVVACPGGVALDRNERVALLPGRAEPARSRTGNPCDRASSTHRLDHRPARARGAALAAGRLRSRVREHRRRTVCLAKDEAVAQEPVEPGREALRPFRPRRAGSSGPGRVSRPPPRPSGRTGTRERHRRGAPSTRSAPHRGGCTPARSLGRLVSALLEVGPFAREDDLLCHAALSAAGTHLDSGSCALCSPTTPSSCGRAWLGSSRSPASTWSARPATRTS